MKFPALINVFPMPPVVDWKVGGKECESDLFHLMSQLLYSVVHRGQWSTLDK